MSVCGVCLDHNYLSNSREDLCRLCVLPAGRGGPKEFWGGEPSLSSSITSSTNRPRCSTSPKKTLLQSDSFRTLLNASGNVPYNTLSTQDQQLRDQQHMGMVYGNFEQGGQQQQGGQHSFVSFGPEPK